MGYLRFRARFLALFGVAVGVLALSAPAGATSSKPYSVVICALGTSEACAPSPTSSANAPAAVPVGGTGVAMTATFTNENKPGSGIQLGSANLTPPAGFTVKSAAVPSSCSGCTANVVGNVVQLRTLSQPPRGVVTVSMTVDDSAASGCLVPNSLPNPTDSTCAWSAEVKQSNDFSGQPGNDLTFDPGASAPYTVLAHPAFGPQPHSATLGSVITGTDFNPFGAPVAVNIVDANGTVDGAYVGEVDLSLTQGTTPQGVNTAASVSGGTATASSGTATFPNLMVTAPGAGYTLTASTLDLPPSTTSIAFDIAQAGETCTKGKACATLDALSTDWPQPPGIDAKASANASSSSADFVESTDFGTPLTAGQCEGYQATHSAFFDVKDASRTVTASITTVQSKGSVTGAMINGQDDCLETVGGGHQFLEIIEGTNTTQPAPQTGTTPAGAPIYTGLLPDCGTKPGQVDSATWPCVSGRTGQPSKVGNGTLTITISVPPGFGDPTHSG